MSIYSSLNEETELPEKIIAGFVLVNLSEHMACCVDKTGQGTASYHNISPWWVKSEINNLNLCLLIRHIKWTHCPVQWFFQQLFEQFLSFVIIQGEEELATFFLRLVAQIQYERNVRCKKMQALLSWRKGSNSSCFTKKCIFLHCNFNQLV